MDWFAEWILLQTEKIGRMMSVKMKEWWCSLCTKSYLPGMKLKNWHFCKYGLWMVWPWQGQRMAAGKSSGLPKLVCMLVWTYIPGWAFFMGNRESPSISRNQVFHKYTHLAIREIGIWILIQVSWIMEVISGICRLNDQGNSMSLQQQEL